jgi:hypothetical protein
VAGSAQGSQSACRPANTTAVAAGARRPRPARPSGSDHGSTTGSLCPPAWAPVVFRAWRRAATDGAPCARPSSVRYSRHDTLAGIPGSATDRRHRSATSANPASRTAPRPRRHRSPAAPPTRRRDQPARPPAVRPAPARSGSQHRQHRQQTSRARENRWFTPLTVNLPAHWKPKPVSRCPPAAPVFGEVDQPWVARFQGVGSSGIGSGARALTALVVDVKKYADNNGG